MADFRKAMYFLAFVVLLVALVVPAKSAQWQRSFAVAPMTCEVHVGSFGPFQYSETALIDDTFLGHSIVVDGCYQTIEVNMGCTCYHTMLYPFYSNSLGYDTGIVDLDLARFLPRSHSGEMTVDETPSFRTELKFLAPQTVTDTEVNIGDGPSGPATVDAVPTLLDGLSGVDRCANPNANYSIRAP